MTNGSREQKVTIPAGEVTVTRFSGMSGAVCKVDGAILFETALSFIRPTTDNKSLFSRVFSMGLTRSPSGSGSVPAPGKFLFIAGHTDKVGSPSSNLALSKRRAKATLAVFNVDEKEWEKIYLAEKWENKTSDGSDIVEVMSREVDIGPVDISRYKTIQAKRLDLMHRYLLSLRPGHLASSSPLPKPALITGSSSPTIHCGEGRPLPNASNTANRRSELFYANVSDPGIKDCTSYRTWSTVCGGQFFNVQLYLENEYGEPLANQPFTLTLPNGGVINDRTDATGHWQGDNLPAGLYSVNADNFELTELPNGAISKINLEKFLNTKDTQIRLQTIDPNKWFIAKVNAQSAIPQFTRGNIVEPLIDGQAMMQAVHRAIVSTRSGHYVYITSWKMTANTRMLGATRAGSEVMTVLLDAIGRGVDVRALLWDRWGSDNDNEQQQIDDASRRPHRGQAILDNETLNLGSHHQKTAIVNCFDGLTAFCGGIDLCSERWDNPTHTIPNRDRENHPNNPKPWHDICTRIKGPAAGDIETNFRERWNNHPQGNANSRTPVPIHTIPSPLSNGSHLVQTLRTFPPRQRYPFAPGGELGLLNAYIRAIGNARNYIYIEDQYLVFNEISNAIGNVLNRLRGKVIIVIPRVTEDPVYPLVCDSVEAIRFHRFDFINRLQRINRSKIEVYFLQNASNPTGLREIYVHAKLMIIDDIWATIGSANIGRRSMTHDSEINIAVIDGAIENGRRKFARDLRISLWTEHLGVGRGAVDDPVASIGLWSSTAAAGGGRIAVYPMPTGNDELCFYNVVDPDGR